MFVRTFTCLIRTEHSRGRCAATHGAERVVVETRVLVDALSDCDEHRLLGAEPLQTQRSINRAEQARACCCIEVSCILSVSQRNGAADVWSTAHLFALQVREAHHGAGLRLLGVCGAVVRNVVVAHGLLAGVAGARAQEALRRRRVTKPLPPTQPNARTRTEGPARPRRPPAFRLCWKKNSICSSRVWAPCTKTIVYFTVACHRFSFVSFSPTEIIHDSVKLCSTWQRKCSINQMRRFQKRLDTVECEMLLLETCWRRSRVESRCTAGIFGTREASRGFVQRDNSTGAKHADWQIFSLLARFTCAERVHQSSPLAPNAHPAHFVA